MHNPYRPRLVEEGLPITQSASDPNISHDLHDANVNVNAYDYDNDNDNDNDNGFSNNSNNNSNTSKGLKLQSLAK